MSAGVQAQRRRASISFRATLMKTSSRSLPAKRSLISSAVPEARIRPAWRKRMRSQASSISFILCFAFKIYKIRLTGDVAIEGYPREIRTLGDHVRAARLKRGLKQWEVAETLGLQRETVTKWESNRGEPRAVDVPGIIRFLAYDPFPEASAPTDRMKRWRLRAGLSARAASEMVGVGTATWAAWERGAQRPNERIIRRVNELMARHPSLRRLMSAAGTWSGRSSLLAQVGCQELEFDSK